VEEIPLQMKEEVLLLMEVEGLLQTEEEVLEVLLQMEAELGKVLLLIEVEVRKELLEM
jgi:hypothetical protein